MTAVGVGGVLSEETLTHEDSESWYNYQTDKNKVPALAFNRPGHGLAMLRRPLTMIDSISLPPNKQEYYVYLIQGERTRHTKIGITNNPGYRLASLQHGSPDTLFIHSLLRCKTESNARLVERKLHKRFAEHRIHGEWFELHADYIYAVSGRKFSRYISVTKPQRAPKQKQRGWSFLSDYAPYMDFIAFSVLFFSVIVAMAAFVTILSGESNWSTWVCLIEAVFSFTIGVLFTNEIVMVNDGNA